MFSDILKVGLNIYNCMTLVFQKIYDVFSSSLYDLMGIELNWLDWLTSKLGFTAKVQFIYVPIYQLLFGGLLVSFLAYKVIRFIAGK